MCAIVTLYHALCQCYGHQTVAGEPCIRAQTASGCSKGCWDTVDLGVKTVRTRCPQCSKTFPEPILPVSVDRSTRNSFMAWSASRRTQVIAVVG